MTIEPCSDILGDLEDILRDPADEAPQHPWGTEYISAITVESTHRAAGDLAELQRSIAELGLLEPVVIDHLKRLRAGRRRLEACRALGWKTIPVVRFTLDASRAELASLESNLTVKPLTELEKLQHLKRQKAIYEALYPESRSVRLRGGPGRGNKATTENAPAFAVKAAKQAGVGKRTVERSIEIANKLDPEAAHAIRDHRIADNRGELARLAKLAAPQQKRAAKILVADTRKTVAGAVHSIRRLAANKATKSDAAKVEFEDAFPNRTPRTFDVWNFNGLTEGYGDHDWPGCIPGELVGNALHYFTVPSDLVVDPMAGGAVTGDVCRAMGRACVMADINPSSKHVSIHDVSTGPIPGTQGRAALVFLDPPYWSLKAGSYAAGSPSELSWPQWCVWLRSMARSAAAMAQPDGYVVCLMQDSFTRDVGRFEAGKSSIIETMHALEEAGLEPITMIACPLSTQQSSGYHVTWAREHRRLLGINRQLLVFRKASGQE